MHVPIVRQMLPFSEPFSHEWPMFSFFDRNQEIDADWLSLRAIFPMERQVPQTNSFRAAWRSPAMSALFDYGHGNRPSGHSSATTRITATTAKVSATATMVCRLTT